MRAVEPGMDVLVPSPAGEVIAEVLAVTASAVVVDLAGSRRRVPMPLIRNLMGRPVRLDRAPRRYGNEPR